MIRGSCLCGDVAWEVDGELDLMTHCHCSRCRKIHGTPFATYTMCDEGAFRMTRGRDRIVRYMSSPGVSRPFCPRCGGVVPDGEPWNGRIVMPAGPLDDDPVTRPLAHIFAASKAPWWDIHDDLPRFDAFPPGVDSPVLPDPPASAPPPGAFRGSCLCGAVAYEVTGKPLRSTCCHCSRCRKARGAAHAANLITPDGAVRFTRGADRLTTYKLPSAQFFTQVFCRDCGSAMPRLDPERKLAFIPMGSLDDDPGMRPERHIFVDSKAPWYAIADDLPQYPEGPPPA